MTGRPISAGRRRFGADTDQAGRLQGARFNPHAHLVKIPGAVFFMPIEAPEPVAEVILEAVNLRTSSPSPG